MKKIILLGLTAGLFGLTSCEGYLTATNIYNKNLDSFYSTPTEISEAVAGMYLAMYISSAQAKEEIVMNITDDIHLGGGEAGGEVSLDFDQFTHPGTDSHSDLWTGCYNGIYRANAIIETLTDAEKVEANLAPYYSSDDELATFVAQSLGEAYFMKGFYYFNLGRWFGGVPIINTTTADRYALRSTFLETFSVAATNFYLAAETLPNKAATAYSTADFGHANRWIAKGYLARTYLYATGYLTNMEGQSTSEIPYYEMDGSLDLATAKAALDDVVNDSGYALVSDFRSLWSYSYANYASVLYEDPAGDNLLPWANQEGLVWAGQDGFTATLAGTTGNSELMFAKMAAFGNWSTVSQQNTNAAMIYFGPRDADAGAYQYGWGWGTINPAYYKSFEDGDVRRDGTIINLDDWELNGGSSAYEMKAQQDYSGYIPKKHAQIDINGYDGSNGMFSYIYDQVGSWDNQLWNCQNYPLLRYADILLMRSELYENADYGMNEVRARAGLEATSYSFEALNLERAWEFATESNRYFDLLRWGTLYNNTYNWYGSNPEVYDNLILTNYTCTPDATQKGLRPIPECEIELSLGMYDQNPGW